MKILLTLFLLIFTFQVSFGQEKSKAELVSEFGQTCSEDVMARFDGFYSAKLNEPTSTSYIIFYGNEANEGRNLSYIYWLANYYKGRVSAENIIRGANQKEEKIQFWIVPQGAELPKPTSEFIPTEINKPTLFDSVWADFHKWYGKLDIYSQGFWDLGCDFPPNQKEFAKVLSSNPNLNGRLVVYNRNKSRAEKVVKFALNQLIKNHKISSNRLTTTYGGKSEEPKLEFWLVPQKKKS